MPNNYYIQTAGNQASGEFCLFSRRINSFSSHQCGVVFGSLAAFTFIVAVVFAVLGAWLILPFAGLEVMALYLAFSWVVRHANDSELLVLRDDAVVLAVREQASISHFEFNRLWAQLVVVRRAHGLRLALRSHGKEVEVGRYLDSDGRQALAQELKARLNPR